MFTGKRFFLPAFSIFTVSALVALGCEAEEQEQAKDTSITDTGTGDELPTEDCQSVTLDEGSVVTYTVQVTGDDHEKHHFDMPAGIDHLHVTSSWDDSTWELEMDVGIGWCPDSGDLITSASGTQQAEVDLYPEDVESGVTTFTEGEQWFVHFARLSDNSTGSSVDIALDVQACASN